MFPIVWYAQWMCAGLQNQCSQFDSDTKLKKMKGRECDLILQLKNIFYVLKAHTADLFKVSSCSLQMLTSLRVFHFDLDQSTNPLLILEAGYTDNFFLYLL